MGSAFGDKLCVRAHLAHLAIGLAVCATGAWAQVAATIDINSTQTTALNAGFSGFNYEAAVPYEPFDYRFNAVAAQLSPGWIRYPAGIAGDAFNWQTGLMMPSWIVPFQSTTFDTTLAQSVAWIAGKGGHQFADVGRQAVFLGAQVIVVVNAFTDTPQSAGQMAAFAKANNIPAAAWEMCNEPYFFVPLFFQSGADYAAKMKPYRDAIKAADPNAVVALFFSDPGRPDPTWDTSLAGYSDKYWDAITYHHYGPQSTGGFSQWMSDENAVLYSGSTAYFAAHVAPLNPPGTKFLISEFNPTGSDLGQQPSLTNGTLYAAIYAAEYTMRMSTVPSMLRVGMHALSSTYAVDAADRHFDDVQTAYQQGTSIDTATLNFGFFAAAQAEGVAILNGVLRNAVQVDATTVTGGASVAATGLGQIPALYARAYTSTAGNQSVVITNKSAAAHQVTVRLNGSPVAGSLPIHFIAGTDPSTLNTSSNQNAVSIQTANSANPIPVPPYSVVRVDLNGGVTIQASPPGLRFTMDGGVAQTAPQTLNLSLGSHTIAVAATQGGPAGTQYVFTGWSDGGSVAHSINVAGGAATYTASVKTQYQLTISALPVGGGTVSPPGGGYYDAGTMVSILASANAGNAFTAWSGGLSGSTNPQAIAMNAAHGVTANFSTPSCTIAVSPATASLPATGTSTPAACPNNSRQSACGFSPETPLTFTVTPSAACGPWTATSSNPGFLQVASGASGIGAGSVSLVMLANTHNGPRNATITVASGAAAAIYSVTQAGSADRRTAR